MSCPRCVSPTNGGRGICLYCGGNAVGAKRLPDRAAVTASGETLTAAPPLPMPAESSEWSSTPASPSSGGVCPGLWLAVPGMVLGMVVFFARVFPIGMLESLGEVPGALKFFARLGSGALFIVAAAVVLGLGIGAIALGARGKAEGQRFAKQAVQYGISVIMFAVMAVIFGLMFSGLFGVATGGESILCP